MQEVSKQNNRSPGQYTSFVYKTLTNEHLIRSLTLHSVVQCYTIPNTVALRTTDMNEMK